jgi:hypothetical protein
MGKNKEASELLDTYLKYFPDSKISYDMFMLPFSEIYYRIGDTAKANRIMKRVAEIFSQNLDYYLSYPPDYRQYFQNDINNNFGMIRRISMIAKDFKQDKLVAEMDRLFTGKIKSYK